jgi:predicted DNA-binding protein (MmcQ/YjbR family)
MFIDEFRDFCLSLPEVTEGFPFDEDTLVFKVNNKVFAITGVHDFDYINLKCDPEKAIELRDSYEAVKPGYHMNKQQWNSVYVNQDVDDQQIVDWTLDSWKLIVQKMKKVDRERLLAILGSASNPN